jgi:hypothetical protein
LGHQLDGCLTVRPRSVGGVEEHCGGGGVHRGGRGG